MNLKFFGESAVTGLEQKQNVLIYVLILAGPFYVIWGLGFMMDMAGLPPEYIIFELALGIVMWGGGTFAYHAKIKMEVASLKAFDSAKVRYDESTVRTLDLMFPENSIKYVGKTSKGREIWRIGPFTNVFGYDHPTEGWIQWNRLFVILPFPEVPWGETFLFEQAGELWHKGIPSDSSNCEGVTLHMSPNWINREGEWIPVALVADSWQHYLRVKKAMLKFKNRKIKFKTTEETKDGKVEVKEETLTLPKDPIMADEIIEARMIAMNKELTDLRLAKKRLAEDREALLNETVIVEDLVDEKVNIGIKRHGNIMRVRKPFRYRFLNMKTGAIIMATAVAFLIVYLFATGV